MLYKHFREKLLGLQGVEIEKIEDIDNSIHIYCKLKLKIRRFPACSATTNKVHDY